MSRPGHQSEPSWHSNLCFVLIQMPFPRGRPGLRAPWDRGGRNLVPSITLILRLVLRLLSPLPHPCLRCMLGWGVLPETSPHSMWCLVTDSMHFVPYPPVTSTARFCPLGYPTLITLPAHLLPTVLASLMMPFFNLASLVMLFYCIYLLDQSIQPWPIISVIIHKCDTSWSQTFNLTLHR